MLAWILSLGLAATAMLSAHALLARRPWRWGHAATVALAIAGAIAARDDLGLQKLIGTLAMPTGLLWLALGLVTIFAHARGQRALAALNAALFVALGLLGSGFVSSALMSALEADYPPVALDGAPLDALIVPGGGAGYNALLEPQLYDYGDRVITAARLYHAGHARALVATGSAITAISHPQDLTEATRTIWRELGVPNDAIIGLPEPKNTSQEIEAAKRLVDERGWTRVGIVGSAFHLPRIMSHAARVELEAKAIPADRRGGPPVLHPLALVPTAGALRTTTLAGWELVGMLVGR